jgi:hypothetical protein
MDVKHKAWQRVNILRSFKFLHDRKSLDIVYMCFIRPILEYTTVVWDNITVAEAEELKSIDIEAQEQHNWFHLKIYTESSLEL